jgi:hypothetical protein
MSYLPSEAKILSSVKPIHALLVNNFKYYLCSVSSVLRRSSSPYRVYWHNATPKLPLSSYSFDPLNHPSLLSLEWRHCLLIVVKTFSWIRNRVADFMSPFAGHSPHPLLAGSHYSPPYPDLSYHRPIYVCSFSHTGFDALTWRVDWEFNQYHAHVHAPGNTGRGATSFRPGPYPVQSAYKRYPPEPRV